nr:phospho-sugar mutase [Bacilli bacterium]
FARDKDGLQAITMYSEMALYYYLQGKTLDMIWEELGQRFGYHEDKVFSIAFSGSEGSEKMKEITRQLHRNPFIELNGQKVVRAEDYYKQEATDGKYTEIIDLPRSDVVKLYFEDGTNISVRPSGTEPKIKFYIGVVGKSLEDARSKPDKYYQALKAFLGIE